MASVFKSTYLMPIPKGAQRCVVKGIRSVRYTDGKGHVQVRPVQLDDAGNETGKMVCEQRTWWMKYTLPGGVVKREKGFTDRLATEQEAARREREAQQAAAGFLVVSGEHLATPLKQHVDTFIEELRRMTHEEAERLLDVAPARRLIYRMAICTGLRRTELKDLQWRDLVLDSPSGAPHIRLRAAATNTTTLESRLDNA